MLISLKGTTSFFSNRVIEIAVLEDLRTDAIDS